MEQKKKQYFAFNFHAIFSALFNVISTEKMSHRFHYEWVFEVMNKPTR